MWEAEISCSDARKSRFRSIPKFRSSNFENLEERKNPRTALQARGCKPPGPPEMMAWPGPACRQNTLLKSPYITDIREFRTIIYYNTLHCTYDHVHKNQERKLQRRKMEFNPVILHTVHEKWNSTWLFCIPLSAIENDQFLFFWSAVFFSNFTLFEETCLRKHYS